MPLAELWNEQGPVRAVRRGDLGEDGVRAQLRLGTEAVLASMAQPLRWLRGAELFEWWKSEARPRLVSPEEAAYRLEDFPDERCWLASEWRMVDDSRTVMLFEERH